RFASAFKTLARVPGTCCSVKSKEAFVPSFFSIPFSFFFKTKKRVVLLGSSSRCVFKISKGYTSAVFLLPIAALFHSSLKAISLAAPAVSKCTIGSIQGCFSKKQVHWASALGWE